MDEKNMNHELAELDYMSGMKYKDIAEKYNVTINTVKSWKTRYNWCKNVKKSVHTKSEKVCTQNELVPEEKKPAAGDVEQIIENAELTDKQRLFCIFYIKCFNATKAYQKAYGVDYSTAVAAGSRMLTKVKVKNEIQKLKKNRLNREMLDPEDIFQKYIDIALADITDFVEFGREEVQVMNMFGPVEVKDPKTGKKVPLMKTINSIRFKESSEVDGTLISEVKQGKDGVSIKLLDKMKALQWLGNQMDLATAEQQERIKLMKAQIERLSSEPPGEDEDGVEIINDAPKEETS